MPKAEAVLSFIFFHVVAFSFGVTHKEISFFSLIFSGIFKVPIRSKIIEFKSSGVLKAPFLTCCAGSSFAKWPKIGSKGGIIKGVPEHCCWRTRLDSAIIGTIDEVDEIILKVVTTGLLLDLVLTPQQKMIVESQESKSASTDKETS